MNYNKKNVCMTKVYIGFVVKSMLMLYIDIGSLAKSMLMLYIVNIDDAYTYFAVVHCV